jgi:ABC-type transporter Mla MlaB component
MRMKVVGSMDVRWLAAVKPSIITALQLEHEVLIDLEDIGDLDVAGVEFLLDLPGSAADHECFLRISRAPEPLQTILELADVGQRLPFDRGT